MNDTTTTAERVGDTELRITRRFASSPQQVFDAHFLPDLVRQWVLGPPGWTMPVCEIKAEVGAHIEFKWQNAEGQRFGLTGTVTELDPPHRSVHSELFDFPGATNTVVETHYRADGNGTLLELRITYESNETREAAMASGMLDGMESSYARVDGLKKS